MSNHSEHRLVGAVASATRALPIALLICIAVAAPITEAQDAEADAPAETDVAADTTAELAAGNAHLQRGEFSQAAAIFAVITAREPANGRAWFLFGYAHHGAGDLDLALAGHLAAVRLNFRAATASYNAACAYALKGQPPLAVEQFENAWRAGFANATLAATDADLASVRDEPRFIELLETMGQTAAPEPVALGDIATVGDPMDGIGGGIAIGDDGSLYIADFLTTIYKLDPEGERTVFATDMAVPSGIAIDSQGRVIQSEFKADRVLRFSPSGDEVEVLATSIPGPVGIVIDADDRIYVTSCHSASIHVIEPDGSQRQLVQSPLLRCPNGITRDEGGDLYVCNYNDGMVLRIDDAGTVTPLVSIPGANNGHITYRHGALWVAGMTANQIFRVALDGSLALIGGTGSPGGTDGPALEALLFRPNAMAFDRSGETLHWNDEVKIRSDPASKRASIVRTLNLRE